MKNYTRIPKTIHYIWVGGAPKPDSVNKYIETWKKYCPDYEIKEWNENNYDITKNRYCREAYEAKKWAFVTDYMRLDILDKEGGIYMDSDVEILKNLDEFLNEPAFSSFEMGDPTKIFLPTGIIGSEKGGAWVKYLKSYYDDEDRSFYKEDGQPDTTTNTNIITKMTEKKYGIKLNNELQKFEDFTMFPSDYFCPKSWSTGDIKLTKNTHTIHHFAMSWVSDNEKKYIDFMRNTKVSIIIPIYNVEKYLEECIDSVINQTYPNLEIILVDDKSPDNSGKIADEYAKKDSRIRVIHKKKNEKLFQARKTGFEVMTGNYFMTVDGDDSLQPNYISYMVEELHKTKNTDIIFSRGMIMKYEDETKNYPVTWPTGANENIGVNYKKYWDELATGNYPWGWNVWGKLYKRNLYKESKSFLNGLDKNITMAEDLLLFSIFGYFAKNPSIANVYGYLYRQSDDASVGTKDIKRISNYIEEVKLVFDTLRKFTKSQKCDEDTIKNVNEFEKVILSGHMFRLEEAKKYAEQPEIKFTGKKRILCPTVFGTMNGGGERSSYVLWRWLNKYYDIVIALPKDTNREYLDACERDGINYVLCDYEHSIENIRMQFDFVKMIYDLKIDIVFPAMYLESALSAAAATNTPAVFLDYGLIGQGVENEDNHLFISKRLKMSNIIIANSLSGVSMANEFAARSAVYAPSYTERPNLLIKRSGKTRLIYPARIDAQQKAQIDLVKAVKLLYKDGVKNKVVIMGGYEPKWPGAKKYYEKIIDYINENGLSNAIELPGWVNNPFSEFSKNDIYVTTTRYEAVGRATLEAVELGIPILIPDIPGHREFREIIGISDEHFYEPGNLVDFKEKAEHLINHIDEAKKRAKEYAKIAEEKFSEENCNKNILEALREIEGQGNPGVDLWIDQQKEIIRNYDERLNIINSLQSEVIALRGKIETFLSTKRAIKLVAGNFVRHIKRKLKLLNITGEKNEKNKYKQKNK